MTNTELRRLGIERRHWGKDGPRSSAVLARLLDAEGFSDHSANQVEGWWRRAQSIGKNFAEIDRLKRHLSELSKKLTEEERKVVGRFIGLHMRMGFDTGLRMGPAVRFVRDEPASSEE